MLYDHAGFPLRLWDTVLTNSGFRGKIVQISGMFIKIEADSGETTGWIMACRTNKTNTRVKK